MKRILQSAVVLGVVSLVGAGVAQAQGAGRASFHVAGGLVLPTGDFGDGFKTGFQGLGGVNFGLSGLPFAIRVDGFYGQNNVDEDAVGPCDGCKTKFFGGLVGGQYNIGGGTSPVHPYILAQVGMTNAKFTASGFSDSETKFTFGGGAGLMFGMGSAHVFVEGKYLSVQTSGGSTSKIPILVGVQFGGGM